MDNEQELFAGTTYYPDNKTVLVGDGMSTVWEITPLETSCYGITIDESPTNFSFQFITSRKIEINPALEFGAIVRLHYRSEP